MKSNKILMIVLSFLQVCILACASSPQDQTEKAGAKTLTISLPGNMSTGYTWTCTMDKSGIVREVSHDYKAEPGIGRGGTFRFVFEGLKAGTVKLSFNYARPWETGKAPAETKVYILSVDTEGKITT